MTECPATMRIAFGLTRLAVLLSGIFLSHADVAATPKATPVVMRADHLRYNIQTETFIATGHVWIRYQGIELHSDFAKFHRNQRKLYARGNVRLFRDGLVSKSERLYLDLVSMTALMQQGAILIRKKPRDAALVKFLKDGDFNALKRAAGSEAIIRGSKVRRLGKKRFSIEGPASYTACICNYKRPDWKITARKGRVTLGRYATLYRPSFCIVNQPIPLLTFPVITVPIGERRSGLLIPRVSLGGRDGIRATLGVYWALHRSADLTTALQLNQNRGVIPELNLRYQISQWDLGEVSVRYLYDLARNDTHRFEIKAAVRQSAGPLQFLFVSHLLSDRMWFQDLATTLLAQSTPHTLSTAALSLEFANISAGVLVDYTQDLAIGDENQQLNLFKGPQRSVIQRLPSAWIWGEFSTGPLIWNLNARYSYFTTMGSTFSDGGTDGLKPGSSGYVGPDADGTENNGTRDPGEALLRAHRLELAQTISFPWDIWGLFHLRSFVTGRYRLLASQLAEAPSHHRLSLLFGADLSTQFWRIYGNTKHVIEPMISYRYQPLLWQRGSATLLPQIEPSDSLARIQRLALRLRTGVVRRTAATFPRNDAHYQRIFDLDLIQEFDFDLDVQQSVAGRIGQFTAIATLNPGYLSLSALLSARWKNPALTELSITATMTHPKGHSMSVSFNRLNTDKKSRFFRDPTLSPLYAGITRLSEQLKQTTVTAGPTIKFGDWVSLSHAMSYSFQENRITTTSSTIGLSSPCKCWSLAVTVVTAFNQKASVYFTLDLKGLGKVQR